ncbi:MAG: hypothetical protein KDC98_04215, partial [Planctomycetes bacterium]|nr:hypothetical protein [Planctomycetota bacterium]
GASIAAAVAVAVLIVGVTYLRGLQATEQSLRAASAEGARQVQSLTRKFLYDAREPGSTAEHERVVRGILAYLESLDGSTTPVDPSVMWDRLRAHLLLAELLSRDRFPVVIAGETAIDAATRHTDAAAELLRRPSLTPRGPGAPGEVEVMRLRAQVLRQAGNLRSQCGELEQAVALWREALAVLTGAGGRAARHLACEVHLDIADAMVRLAGGTMHEALEQAEAALGLIDTAPAAAVRRERVDRMRLQCRGLALRGQALSALWRHADARVCFERLVEMGRTLCELDPDGGPTLITLTRCFDTPSTRLLSAGDPGPIEDLLSDVAGNLERRSREDPRDGALRRAMARVLLTRAALIERWRRPGGGRDLVLEALALVDEVDAQSLSHEHVVVRATARFRLAASHARMKEWIPCQQECDEAIAAYRGACEQSPEDMWLRSTLGLVMVLRADACSHLRGDAAAVEEYAAAVEVLDGVVATRSDDWALALMLVHALQGHALNFVAAGDDEAALEVCAQALALPVASRADAPVSLALTVARLRRTKALSHLKRADPRAAACELVAGARQLSTYLQSAADDTELLLTLAQLQGQLAVAHRCCGEPDAARLALHAGFETLDAIPPSWDDANGRVAELRGFFSVMAAEAAVQDGRDEEAREHAENALLWQRHLRAGSRAKLAEIRSRLGLAPMGSR